MKNTIQRNEIEAMTIICNIQMMQDVAYGQRFEYNQFSANSVEELRKLQESLIPVYNAAIAAKNDPIIN